MKIYCAGPLFNQAERDEMTAIAEALVAAGYAVYLPHRDGMEFRLVHDVLIDRGWEAAIAGQFLHEAIFALDVYQLAVDCQAMVWNLNGRVPDEGAVSEAAMVWTLGKPLVAYRNDVRSMIAGRMNPLLAGLVDFTWVETIDAIVPALQEELILQPPMARSLEELSPRMRKAVSEGSVLWSHLQTQSAACDNERLADCVTELFAPSSSHLSHRLKIHRRA
jgi:nucleoside 2-deoxyribosyltransferase